MGTSLTIAKVLGATAMFNPMGYALGGFLLSLGGVVGVNRSYYEHVTENLNGTHVYKTLNSISRLLSYSAVVTGNFKPNNTIFRNRTQFGSLHRSNPPFQPWNLDLSLGGYRRYFRRECRFRLHETSRLTFVFTRFYLSFCLNGKDPYWEVYLH